MQEAPVKNHLWLTYWLIKINHGPFGAGLAGFKAVPDLRGTIEIGYGIDSEYWNQGYMTEAASVLVEWALNQPECTKITANEIKKPRFISSLTKDRFYAGI